MDDEGNFVMLGSGEDLLATIEGEDGVSVNIPASAKWQNSFWFLSVLLVFLVPGNLERELDRKITTFCKVQIRVGLGWA